MTKKTLIILIVCIGCLTGSYFFIKPTPASHTELALSHLKESRYGAADAALRTLSTEPMPYPLALYKGYLEQARGRYLESDLHLKPLLKEAPRKLTGDAALEVLLVRASNAFFERRDEDLDSLLHSASRLSAHNPYLFFFSGLQNYFQAEYKEALHAWKAYNLDDAEEGTGWMPVMIDKLFPHSWRQLHVAHCMTEEGDLLSSREILERESHQLEDQELAHLATLYLGLTYLKEARHIALDQRGSYYKLARFYFERSGRADTFERERQLIAKDVEKEAKELVLNDLGEEKVKWGFDFVHTLLDWKANPSLASVTEELADKLLRHKGEEEIALCQLIRQDFLGSPFHNRLTQKLINSMARGLKEGETEDLYEIWALIETLSPSPKLLTKEIASLTSEEILRTINRDNKELTHTQRYLAFWEKLGRNARERELLARNLFAHAKLFWQQENQEEKGEKLMDLALQLSASKPRMEGEITRFLTSLYTMAEESNLMDRLMVIFDAMDHFQINKQELANPTKMANHLADAEYLYKSHNYSLCKAHSMWALKLEPENTSAQRLMGLSSFHLGEYGRALYALKKLDNPDEDARKALMLSQVFASQEQDKHLCQIDNIDSFDEDD